MKKKLIGTLSFKIHCIKIFIVSRGKVLIFKVQKNPLNRHFSNFRIIKKYITYNFKGCMSERFYYETKNVLL